MTIKKAALWTLVVLGIAANLKFQDSLASDGIETWELQQLHTPSPALRQQEDAGRITIYDGIRITEIDRAMDEQFERIDSMMFIRSNYVDEDGEWYEDDDCD
jgi:hypothetical protein